MKAEEVITCPVCSSEMVHGGAVSMGDGDLSDEYVCEQCGETQLVGTRWLSSDGEWFDDFDEMLMHESYSEGYICHECEQEVIEDEQGNWVCGCGCDDVDNRLKS